MAKVKIYPGALSGIVNVPSSKSMGHREIICAALAQGISVIDNISTALFKSAWCTVGTYSKPV